MDGLTDLRSHALVETSLQTAGFIPPIMTLMCQGSDTFSGKSPEHQVFGPWS